MLPLLITLATAALAVRGDSLCPTPELVQQHLDSLDPGAAGWVDVVSFPEAVELTYWSADQLPLARRRLERQGACGDLAQASAVVIATWAARPTPPPPLPTVTEVAPEPTTLSAEPERRLQPGVSLGARLLVPVQTPDVRASGPLLASTVTIAVDYLKSNGFGGRVEAWFSPPAATWSPFFSPRTLGVGLGAGPVFRLDVSPAVTVDLAQLTSLSVLFANDNSSPFFCVSADVGATVLFGKDGLVPYLRVSGGLTHQTLTTNVLLPGAFLAVGVTWMRT